MSLPRILGVIGITLPGGPSRSVLVHSVFGGLISFGGLSAPLGTILIVLLRLSLCMFSITVPLVMSDCFFVLFDSFSGPELNLTVVGFFSS